MDRIYCHRLPDSDPANQCEALSQREHMAMKQSWRGDIESGFRPCHVRVGWTSHALKVFAVLWDDDIFTDVTAPNQETWRLGDVFEMFLQPADRSDYVELHVTPENIRTQLHFEHAGAPRRELPDGIFSSEVVLDLCESKWTVVAEIPALVVSGNSQFEINEAWRFSFSRYDASRDGKPPVLSSTSPHQSLHFHRTHEWGEMVFV